MQADELLMREYDNLWREKLLHKESQRKFYNYISYLSSVGSLALLFLGLSTTSFFQGNLPAHSSDIIRLVCIPLPPIVILFASFILNDTFQLYVIGAYIGSIEQRINQAMGEESVLRWESRVCPVVFGGRKALPPVGKEEALSNIIWNNTLFIMAPLFALVALSTAAMGAATLYSLPWGAAWCAVYLAFLAWLMSFLARGGYILARLSRADGPFRAFMRA